VRYLRAALLALIGAVALGSATGFLQAVSVSQVGTKSRAETFAIGLATGLNCAALFAVLLVPVAVLVTYGKGRFSGARTPFR